MHAPVCSRSPKTRTKPGQCSSENGMSFGNGYGCMVNHPKLGLKLNCAKSKSACQQVCKSQGLSPKNCSYGQAHHQTKSMASAFGSMLKDLMNLPGMLFCDMIGGCGKLKWLVFIIIGIIILGIIVKVMLRRGHSKPQVVYAK